MRELTDILSHLPARHLSALQWFAEHAGAEHGWPEPLPGGTLLANKAKGIYKPAWTEYALSVRQVLNGPYLDLEPAYRSDGTWSYSYFQENTNPDARDHEYTNRGLMACWRDQVPVGVMRQISNKSPVRYRILGLALITGWDGGYFFLESLAPGGHPRSRSYGPSAEISVLAAAQEETGSSFDPDSTIDGRKKIVASIVRRQGQSQFRRKLLEAYEYRCAITNSDVREVLEAAHITPYRGPDTNHPSNGLLLRADIHTLFDLGLLTIDTDSMSVVLAPSLSNTNYGELAGAPLRLPNVEVLRPSVTALEQHRTWANPQPQD